MLRRLFCCCCVPDSAEPDEGLSETTRLLSSSDQNVHYTMPSFGQQNTSVDIMVWGSLKPIFDPSFFAKTPVHKVVCGVTHTAMIAGKGELYTWGDNKHGQLGHGDSISLNSPKQVAKLSAYQVKDVALGNYHSVALCAPGVVFVWGHDSWLIRSPQANASRVPQLLTSFGQIQCIAAKNETSLAAAQGGNLYLWGMDFNSQRYHIPFLVKQFDSTVQEMAIGSTHALVLTAKGDVYAWGDNTYGEVGLAASGYYSQPTLLPSLRELHIKHIGAGSRHSAVLTAQGQVYCFGDNSDGQCGVTDSRRVKVPVLVDSPIQGEIASLAVGARHVAVTTDSGVLYTWGYGNNGCLGYSSSQESKPKRVQAVLGKQVLTVAVGASQTVAITVSASSDAFYSSKSLDVSQ